jgi:hypothetical protein
VVTAIVAAIGNGAAFHKGPAQCMMASRAGSHVAEAPGSDAICVSNPEVVAEVIRQAAK